MWSSYGDEVMITVIRPPERELGPTLSAWSRV